MDQIGFFFSGWEPLFRIVTVGTLAYIALVALLRVGHKRCLAQLNTFDFVIVVALGASFGRILTARQVSLAEAVTAFALLLFLQYVISRLQMRSKWFSHAVTAPPSLLYYQGRFLKDEMKRERMTKNELYTVALRNGVGSLDEVDAIVLEANGKFGVVKKQKANTAVLVEEIARAQFERQGS